MNKKCNFEQLFFSLFNFALNFINELSNKITVVERSGCLNDKKCTGIEMK